MGDDVISNTNHCQDIVSLKDCNLTDPLEVGVDNWVVNSFTHLGICITLERVSTFHQALEGTLLADQKIS